MAGVACNGCTGICLLKLSREPALVVLGVHTGARCAQIVYASAPKYLFRDYTVIMAKVYIVWVHGPLGLSRVSFRARR